jgi:4-hydroxy-3-polyprenylbenzoate decarboxylase
MGELRHVALAITGASGAVYGLRLAEELLGAGLRLSLVISSAGLLVLREEQGIDLPLDPAEQGRILQERFGAGEEMLTCYGEKDFLAPMASGSAAPDAMVVCPCSMGTLGRIAAGLSGTLIERAADVAVKEGRPLLLVPRETPLSAIHLENMLKLARLGVKMVPPMPGFYGHPQTMDDLVDFVVGKVLDQLGVEHALFKRWGAKE